MNLFFRESHIHFELFRKSLTFWCFWKFGFGKSLTFWYFWEIGFSKIFLNFWVLEKKNLWCRDFFCPIFYFFFTEENGVIFPVKTQDKVLVLSYLVFFWPWLQICWALRPLPAGRWPWWPPHGFCPWTSLALTPAVLARTHWRWSRGMTSAYTNTKYTNTFEGSVTWWEAWSALYHHFFPNLERSEWHQDPGFGCILIIMQLVQCWHVNHAPCECFHFALVLKVPFNKWQTPLWQMHFQTFYWTGQSNSTNSTPARSCCRPQLTLWCSQAE